MKNRLDLFYSAGSHLFINKGYARTQMKDIAQHIGLSTGMIYQYFKGKNELLSFILKCTIEPSYLEQEQEYPIQVDQFDYLDEEIDAALQENAKTLSAGIDDPAYTPEKMFSDAFDVIAKYGVGCLIIEHNPDDLPELTEIYQTFRQLFFKQVYQYAERFIKEGSLRAVPDIHYATRAMVEVMAFWGMHIMNDAYEMDQEITHEQAKSFCLDNLVHAYVVK